MPQRPHSGVVQPQNSMTEALPTITLLLTIDRTARSCRASNESTWSELFLHLHIIVGAIELRRSNQGPAVARVADS